MSFWVFALISGFTKTLIYSLISEGHICARDKRMGGVLLAGGLSQQRLLWGLPALGLVILGGWRGWEETQGM